MGNPKDPKNPSSAAPAASPSRRSARWRPARPSCSPRWSPPRRKAKLDTRDRGLALELTSGVLRWQRRLDHRIAPFLRRGLEETDPGLLRILRLAVYQLDYMDRVPARAAVHEAVQQARSTSGEGGSRLVNAVLRAVTQTKESLPHGDTPEAVGVRLSHPDWLAARAIALLGVDDATALLAAHNRPAPLTIRACVPAEVLIARITDEGGRAGRRAGSRRPRSTWSTPRRSPR